MKAIEAVRIRGLLAGRRPPVTYVDAAIESIRMLVIIGDEVDTVIRFSRGGSADMPQLSTYPDVAESAAFADQKLTKQRASGRRNTTGEGSDWPRDWKLDKARAAGKIWYAESQPSRLKPTSPINAGLGLLPKSPTTEGLRASHEKYKATVSNSYTNTIRRISAALSRRNPDEVAAAMGEWLQDLNRQYFRFRPAEAATLVERLRPITRRELDSFLKLHQRSIKTLAKSDENEVRRWFGMFRLECGPVGAGKALHVLAPDFFPLWDDKIAQGYGVAKDDVGYFRFMNILKEQVQNLPEGVVSDVTVLKALDEYNYLQISANAAVCA